MASQDNTHRLYGVPHSLYTGIARCYLRTQGIAYTEIPTCLLYTSPSPRD